MDFSRHLKELRKSIGSESFADSRYTDDTEFISTGYYALNRIISGSVYGGIPTGRLTLLNGESQTGKSFIAAKCIQSAQQDENHIHTFYIDSEGGALMKLMQNLKLDLNRIEHVMVMNAEDALIQCRSILETIADFQKPKPIQKSKKSEKTDQPGEKTEVKVGNEKARFLIVIDSLGGLRASKLYDDADKGKNVTDMGTTARKIGDLIVSTTMPALRTRTAVILLNHIYQNPGQMMPSKIKEYGGGLKTRYMPRVTVQCTQLFQKEISESDSAPEDRNAFYQGNRLSFFTIKTNNVRPFQECAIVNNFLEDECDPYDGLFDVAVDYGLIVRDNSYYTIPEYSGDKKWYRKQLAEKQVASEFWPLLLPKIDERSKKELAYGSGAIESENGQEQDV
jgi:RecA/RadA recombinase